MSRLGRNWRSCLAFTILVAAGALPAACDRPAAYPISPVPFTQVKLTDTFWAPRLEINRTVTIPFGFAKSEQEGPYGTSNAPRTVAAAATKARCPSTTRTSTS
jgi:hypothetical protein